MFPASRLWRLRLQAISSAILVTSALCGCGADKLPDTTSGAPDTTGGDTTSGSHKSLLPKWAPTSPGPYTTTMVGDAEMRVGRFPVGEPGGTLLRSMVGTDPKTFNYWAADDTGSGEMAGLMFSGPVTMDAYTGEMIPDLAESFTIDPDGVTYTTKLRKGLVWSDGQPITADDVAFTWNTLIGGGYGNSSTRDNVSVEGKMPTVTVVDPLTNKFVTPKPFAPFKRALTLPIAPKHIIEPILKKADGRSAFNRLWSATLDPATLVVSGPFKLMRYTPAQRVEFEPNKKYTMVNKDKKPLPYLSRLVYQIVPDPNTNLLKFRAKEIDISMMRAKDLADLLPVQEKENFKLYNLGAANGTNFLMFNMNRRKTKKGKPYVDPIKSAWFNDTNFRQAVNHTINRDEIVQNYFKGIGALEFGSMTESSPWFDKDLKPFQPDPAYAQQLLQKSGFTKKPDGFLYDKNNNKVEFTLNTVSGSTFYEAMGNIIVENLKGLGITADLQPIAFNVMGDKLSNSLDWEACLMSLGGGDPLEPNSGTNIFRSDARMHMFDQRSQDASGKIVATDVRPWEKRIDALITQGAEEMDTAQRHKIYDEIQQIIYDECPFIYTVTPMNLVAARNTLQNYSPTALSAEVVGLHNIEEIWKKTK